MSDEHDIAEDEAAAWAIALSENPDDAAQQMRFASWLSASSANAEAWARTERVYAALRQVEPTTQGLWPRKVSSDGASDVPKDPSEILTHPRKKRLFRVRNAVAALAACFAVVAFPFLKLRLSADFITATAEQQTIGLEDGSRAHLAPESAMAVEFTLGERRVRLLKGAAFFEVSPDPSRPFSVDAGGTRATVLGTAFSVNRSEEGSIVSVAHGRVKVEDDSVSSFDAEVLTEGQKLTVVWGTVAMRSDVVPAEVGQWRRGELIARDVSIGQIVDALGAYHSGVIMIPDSFAHRRVTGLYRLDTPIETLKNLAASHGATVSETIPWVLRVSEN